MTQIRLSLPQAARDNVIGINVRHNGRTLIPMLLDTRAKYTVITSNVARRLEIDIQSGKNALARAASFQPTQWLARLDARIDSSRQLS